MYFFELLFAVVLILIASFAIFYIDRKVLAISYRATGPIGTDRFGFLQFITDMLKGLFVKSKQVDKSLLRSIYFMFYVVSPFLFCFIVMSTDLFKFEFIYNKVIVLFIVLIVSRIIDNIFIFNIKTKKQKMEQRRKALINFVGVTALVVSVSPSLIINEREQNFHIFASPFLLFLSGSTFLAIMYSLGMEPIFNSKKQKFVGSLEFLYTFAHRAWIAALLIFWVHVYIGSFGPNVFFSMLVNLLITIFLYFLYILFKRSMPVVRTQDAMSFYFKKYMPITCVMLFMHIWWMVFV